MDSNGPYEFTEPVSKISHVYNSENYPTYIDVYAIIYISKSLDS